LFTAFDRYIGIDYSGAETPKSSLKGLRIYSADRRTTPAEVPPPKGPAKYWTRKGIAEWLVEQLSGNARTLVGIDHGFSFPIQYFDKYQLPLDWPAFLRDFQKHWPTDMDNTYVDFVIDGVDGNGAARTGNSLWRRTAEVRSGSAKSVFHFHVPGSVAKSTHSGLPWLLYIRRQVADRVHFWPFDGWEIAKGKSVIAEAYPSLWSRGYAREGRTPDQHDAFSIAAWMQMADAEGSLPGFFEPPLTMNERELARIEGWILGVM
jgi:hypothetical protein